MAEINDSLINSVIEAESSGRPKAESPKGAAGLMQLRKIAWIDVQDNYPKLKKYDYDKYKFDPDINKKFGTLYLKILNKRLGEKATLQNLLASYNWGLSNVKKVGYDFNKFPTETKKYIIKVLDLLKTKTGTRSR